jgi:hypothetical protein
VNKARFELAIVDASGLVTKCWRLADLGVRFFPGVVFFADARFFFL